MPLQKNEDGNTAEDQTQDQTQDNGAAGGAGSPEGQPPETPKSGDNGSSDGNGGGQKPAKGGQKPAKGKAKKPVVKRYQAKDHMVRDPITQNVFYPDRVTKVEEPKPHTWLDTQLKNGRIQEI